MITHLGACQDMMAFCTDRDTWQRGNSKNMWIQQGQKSWKKKPHLLCHIININIIPGLIIVLTNGRCETEEEDCVVVVNCKTEGTSLMKTRPQLPRLPLAPL